MDPQPTAPPVVAVVVTCDAGPWLEEALASLGAQDYPTFSVLVIDAASAEDPTARVAAVLPNAFIRRLPANKGWPASVNEVLGMVEGAAYFVLCHDDVALAPDAVRILVEEALRSNAGIVGPKLVNWDEPERLLQVGVALDRTGHPSPLVDRGELDQEQHDAVRDVFAIPGGCTLVRADLFAELGGLDAEMTVLGDDVDLCWRAQVAGARVLVAPDARVRHLEALPRRRGDVDRRRLQTRHRLRAVLKSYGLVSLLLVLPRVLLTMFAEIVYALVAGRRGQARDVADALAWNARHGRELLDARRRTQRLRRMGDHEIRRLQVGGNVRVRAFVRGQLGGEDRAQALAVAGRDLVGSFRRGARRAALVTWLVIAVVLLFGSRSLLGGRLPVVGQLAALPDHASVLLRHAVAGWRFAGLGSSDPAPTAFGLLGVAGMALLGAMGVLQKLLVLGMLPLGAIGAWRAARPLAAWSPRARLVATVLYAANPLPYQALARGRWGGLIAYAAMPFVLARLLRATGAEPWEGDPRPWRRHLVPLGLLLAAAGSLVPALVPLTIGLALALVVGIALTPGRGGFRALGIASGAGVLAALLCLPWSLTLLLPGAEAAMVGAWDLPASRGLPLSSIVRFATDGTGTGVPGLALLVAAALPLVIGRGWRLTWAIRLWTVAIVAFAVALAGSRSWLPLPPPDVLLTPAAVALALSAALGMVAFEVDLPAFRFGWRQGASVVAAVAAAAAVVPVIGLAFDGRWHLPARDIPQALAWMRDEAAGAPHRVLWLGDPELLPVDGWELEDGVAWGLTRGSVTSVTELLPVASDGATGLVRDALHVATDGRTTRLGRLLGPMAIRYVVVVQERAPGEERTRVAVPDRLRGALAAQLDLRRRSGDDALVVYENAAWAPLVAAAPALLPNGPEAALTTDLAGARRVLGAAEVPTRWRGRVPGGSVLLAEAASPRWQLRVDGGSAVRERSFGWANRFTVAEAGRGTLRLRTPFWVYGIALVMVVVWLAVARSAYRHRLRRVEARAAAPVQPGRRTEREQRERRHDALVGAVWNDDSDDEVPW